MNETINVLKWVGNALLAGAAWVLMYTGLPAEPSAILVVLMTIDFFTGIARARRLGHPITSWRIKTGVVSKCSVFFIPLVIALAAKGLGTDFIWLVEWTVRFVILSEAYSIIANSYTVKTGIAVPEWDATAAILRRLRAMLDNMSTENK